MPATILTGFSGQYEFEPEIITENGRDGITAFQFKIIGSFSSLNSAFQVAERISGVPDQPPGDFRVVNRSLEHIAGDAQTGLYRLSVSGEGGIGDTALEITQSSYAYQKEEVSGTGSQFVGGDQLPARWILEWLSPSVSITTNSREPNVSAVQDRAKSLVSSMEVQIIRNKPSGNFFGPAIDVNKIIITGSNIETAGALYRVSATATKGMAEEII